MEIRCPVCGRAADADPERSEHFASYVLRLAEVSAKPIEAMGEHELRDVVVCLVGSAHLVLRTEAGKRVWERVAARLMQFPTPAGKVTGDDSAWIISSRLEKR